MKSDESVASDPCSNLAGRNFASGFTLLAASSALPNHKTKHLETSIFQVPLVNIQGTSRTRFKGLHLLHPIGAFSQDHPRLQVNLVPLFVREPADARPRFFGTPEIENACRLAGGVGAGVHVQVRFSYMGEHSCQSGDVVKLKCAPSQSSSRGDGGSDLRRRILPSCTLC